jgi:glutaminase
MDMSPRASSSVYSDTFELDDLLQRLSQQTWEQGDYTMHVLLEENEALNSELTAVRATWASIYEVMINASEIASHLQILAEEGETQMEKARRKWIANCTAF